MIDNINKEELFIAKKMIEGDEDAFKYFFDKYYTDLCNFVDLYLNEKTLSEEIVQDIFVYFWENKSRLHFDKSVRSYLYSASKFRSLNEIRSRKIKNRVVNKLKILETNFFHEPDNSFLDTKQLQEILNTAINKLPPKCREIFLLNKDKKLTNKEIASELNLSLKTVEGQLTIALKKLRGYLAPYREKIFILFLFYILSQT